MLRIQFWSFPQAILCMFPCLLKKYSIETIIVCFSSKLNNNLRVSCNCQLFFKLQFSKINKKTLSIDYLLSLPENFSTWPHKRINMAANVNIVLNNNKYRLFRGSVLKAAIRYRSSLSLTDDNYFRQNELATAPLVRLWFAPAPL